MSKSKAFDEYLIGRSFISALHTYYYASFVTALDRTILLFSGGVIVPIEYGQETNCALRPHAWTLVCIESLSYTPKNVNNNKRARATSSYITSILISQFVTNFIFCYLSYSNKFYLVVMQSNYWVTTRRPQRAAYGWRKNKSLESSLIEQCKTTTAHFAAFEHKVCVCYESCNLVEKSFEQKASSMFRFVYLPCVRCAFFPYSEKWKLQTTQTKTTIEKWCLHWSTQSVTSKHMNIQHFYPRVHSANNRTTTVRYGQCNRNRQ